MFRKKSNYRLICLLIIFSNQAFATQSEHNLTLHFQSTPINTVLTYLMKESGVTIISDYKDPITLYAPKPVSLDKALSLLNIVLKQHGYTITKENDILIITQIKKKPREISPPQENPILQIYEIKYNSADNIAKVLTDVLQIKVSAEPYSNTILVNATEEIQSQVKTIVSQLDINKNTQSEVTRVYLTYAHSSDVVDVIQNILNEVMPSKNLVVADNRTNSLVIIGNPDCKKIINYFDEQINIQGMSFVQTVKNANAQIVSQIFSSVYGKKT